MIDPDARHVLAAEVLGKHLLVTDHPRQVHDLHIRRRTPTWPGSSR
jgi:hypothetical protein